MKIFKKTKFKNKSIKYKILQMIIKNLNKNMIMKLNKYKKL